MFTNQLSNKLFIFIAALAIASSGFFVWSQMNTVASTASETSDSSLLISAAEARLKKDRGNVDIAIGLTDLYLQQQRESGDAEMYTKIEAVLNNLPASTQKDARVLAKRAEIANGRHDFKQGLMLISEAITAASGTAAYYGIKADALVELGMYDDAQASLQTMVDLKPNFSSFTRIAYQRELYGDIEGAVLALDAALSAGSSYPENVAWAHVEVGKLLFLSDKIKAVAQFNRALMLFPNYAPALEGLGHVLYVEGSKEEALVSFTKAFEALPIAQYAVTLGEYYEAEGDTDKAAQYYALIDLAYRDAKGVNVDLEYSQFLSNHGDAGTALTLAESAYAQRPSIYTADAYAWALHINGRTSEAEKFILEALRLGEFDASILYHTSEIFKAQGKDVESQKYLEMARRAGHYGSIKLAALLEGVNE